MRTAAAIILTVTICGPATAAASPCAIRVFAVGQELSVHASPSAASPRLRRVDAEHAELELREERSGWFRVVTVEDVARDESLFMGSGWVHGSGLALSISGSGNRILYAGPSEDSRAVLRVLSGGETSELVGCAGNWAKVRFGDHAGWLAPSGQCSSALTTCS